MIAIATAPTVTVAQLERARRLARAFGHTWGHTPDDVLATASVAAIAAYWERALTEAGRAGWAWGITAPSVCPEEGTINHTTASGRLSWFVAADGETTIQIDRPGWVTVLRAVVPGDAALEYGDSGIAVEVAGTYHERHLIALAEAVGAIMDGTGHPGALATFAALAPLWAGALPDGETAAEADAG